MLKTFLQHIAVVLCKKTATLEMPPCKYNQSTIPQYNQNLLTSSLLLCISSHNKTPVHYSLVSFGRAARLAKGTETINYLERFTGTIILQLLVFRV